MFLAFFDLEILGSPACFTKCSESAAQPLTGSRNVKEPPWIQFNGLPIWISHSHGGTPIAGWVIIQIDDLRVLSFRKPCHLDFCRPKLHVWQFLLKMLVRFQRTMREQLHTCPGLTQIF